MGAGRLHLKELLHKLLDVSGTKFGQWCALVIGQELLCESTLFCDLSY